MNTFGVALRHLFTLCCVCPLLAVAVAATAQDSIPQVGPPAPHTFALVKCCMGVKCIGSNSWVVIPGYGNDTNSACADAVSNAEAHCGGAQNVAGIRQTRVEIMLCPYAELEVGMQVAKRMLAQAAVWRVKGTLSYCDGTEGFEFITSGATRCEAIRQAQTQLCLAKDPCKRAYVQVCIIEMPCPQCPPTNCYRCR